MVSGINRGWSVLCGILLIGWIKIRFPSEKGAGVKNRDCPLGRGICTEKLRPTFQLIGVAILFRSNLFPCNEFTSYDSVALGVLAVDVLVAFRGIESLGNIRRFCSALNPQIVVYGL